MDIGPETRIREIAIAIPASLRLFERFGIDYCCGGGRPLREGCARADASLDAVLAGLDALGVAPADPADVDWSRRSIDALLDHLIDHHHAFARSELARATALAEKVLRVHGDRHSELEELHARVLEVRDDVLPHLAKEEQVLFPWIRSLASGVAGAGIPGASLAMPIQCMTSDHDELGALLARIRELTSGFAPPEGACGSFRALYACLADFEADMHRHVHLENDVLFPAALALAGPSSAPAEGARA